MRIGLGHDTHRLSDGGPLRIGGVTIDYPRHLVGHSDADVLFHAITDALLGAIAQGDIGELFPDTDGEHQDRDSSDFLIAVRDRVAEHGYQIVNLDCTIFAQQPKLSPYKNRMRQQIATRLGLVVDVVSVKAKTGEEVGPIGRGEAISAACVVLLAVTPNPIND